MHYYDRYPIDSMMEKLNIDKWLIYQTKLMDDSILYSRLDDDKIVTFLFWLNKGQTYIKLITNTHIYSTFELSNSQIFSYKYFEKVWADTKENNFLIVPPMLEPYDSEIVIHGFGVRKIFFVFGYNYSYTEEPKKHRYRKEFIEIIRHEAITNLERFNAENNYYRMPLFDIEVD